LKLTPEHAAGPNGLAACTFFYNALNPIPL